MQHKKFQFKFFEHERCFVDRGEKPLDKDLYALLLKYHGDGVPYFKLLHRGIKFNEHVGVIQLGKYLIEVLPKADKALIINNADEIRDTQENRWHGILLNMIRTIWNFPVVTTSEANLKIKQNNLLDLYFELFVKEVEYLWHLGLIKKYVREEGNLKALKGKLLFQKHISQNLVHKERFYVQYSIYHQDHQLNQILHTALTLLIKLNKNPLLQSRIHHLLLSFQDLATLKVSEKTFSDIQYNRKNKSYHKAIEIAHLLLLNYHPDISSGKNNVLALMFDMNALWEEFVAVVLRKGLKEHIIRTQSRKAFWRPKNGYGMGMIPDIIVEQRDGNKNKYVLDTKWKNLNGYIKPSPDDLRQMYVYHEYFDAKKVALVYPGLTSTIGGNYYHRDGACYEESHDMNKHCAIIQIGINEQFSLWKTSIIAEVARFVG
ncbi:MAG: restriction endonuclease [Pedobacter sp.]|nr:MAG: restriction endonuclease [Pedobacter sp.]